MKVTWAHPATFVEPKRGQRPDGDTFRMRLDLGTYCGVQVDPVVRLRLEGADAWELKDPKGPEARDFALLMLRNATEIVVQTVKGEADETLGRVVGRVWVDGVDLGDLLRERGYTKS